MTDPFTDAGATVDDSQRQLLAALAEGGTQGRQRFEATQAQLRADKAAAVKQALLESALRGAPAAMQQLTASRIGAPYDQRISDVGMAQGDLERRLAGMQASGQQYFAEAKGAIPVIREQALRDAQAREAAAAAKAAHASGADRGALYGLSRELGGIENTNRYLVQQSDAASTVPDSVKKGFELLRKMGNLDGSHNGDKLYDKLVESYSRGQRAKFENDNGLPRDYTYGLSQAAKGKAKPKTSDAARIHKLPQYKKILTDAQALLSAADVTSAQARAALYSDYGRSNANTLALVLKELGL